MGWPDFWDLFEEKYRTLLYVCNDIYRFSGMKPVNNRIYCIGCRHTKMLFETESNANNFIKFNASEFDDDGKVPVRCYYCAFCCGWHVTSMEEGERSKASEERDARLMKAVESHSKGTLKLTTEGRDIKSRIIQIAQTLEKCRQELLRGRQSSAKEWFDVAGRMFLAIEATSIQKNFQNPAIASCRGKILAYEAIFDKLDDPSFDEEAKKNYLQVADNKKEVLWKFLKIVEVQETMKRLFSEAEEAKCGNDFARLDDLCVEMKTVLEQKGIDGISSIRKEFNAKIEKLVRDIPNRKLKKMALSLQDKHLLLSIIETLEEAGNFLDIGQSDKCANLLKTAECLMPDNCTEEETILWNHINRLRERMK